MSNRLAGKVAIVTGGASGLGEGIVRRFVDEDARVVIADVQESAGRALAAAHPHTEFTTSIVVPSRVPRAASTSSAVRSSSTPRRVSSSRIGCTSFGS